MAPTKVLPIESNEEFTQQTASLPASALQILYFHAPWAAPCAQMSTVLDALASTYEVASPPQISFLAINAEELPDVSEDHDVTAVPFVVLKREGKVLETVSGSDAMKVRAAVERYAGQGMGGGQGKSGAVALPAAQTVTRPAQQNLATAAPVDGQSHTASNGGEEQTRDTSIASTAASTTNDTPAEDLNTRLQSLVSAAPCMLFMKGTPSAPQCGFSRQLVSILRQEGVRYGFFNILADDEVRQGLKEYADWPTFPQLWLSGELVGGLDIVKEELEGNPGFFGEYSVGKKGVEA